MLIYGTGFFVLIQLVGMLMFICIPKHEMAKKDLDLLYINPTTPKNLRITVCLSIYMSELLSILCQTWLYLDIDFLKLGELDGFKMHIRFDRTLLFGVSMTGSLLLILSTPIICSSISNL